MGGVVAEIDPEEICAEDDDREACEDLIEELVSLGDSRVWDVGAASSAPVSYTHLRAHET